MRVHKVCDHTRPGLFKQTQRVCLGGLQKFLSVCLKGTFVSAGNDSVIYSLCCWFSVFRLLTETDFFRMNYESKLFRKTQNT